MNEHFSQVVLQATQAQDFFVIEKIQDLWSGYGVLMRYGLKGSNRKTVIVKHVRLPKDLSHPRGWNTNLSHSRKLKSYQVETFWYHHWSRTCDEACRVPECLAWESQADEFLIVLEDLNGAGYGARRHSVDLKEIKVCLKWLANFHATFINKAPKGLWDVGTYWHLATRPDEWNALEHGDLKAAAQVIDQKLTNTRFQTFVHGDAKLANFCFSPDGRKVAAVDFQYVGGGCGMKDVAYFIGSCLPEEECAQFENQLLDFYFKTLSESLTNKKHNIDGQDLESDWRNLYPVAWTDFHRFMKGWSPGHWKINSYSERLARQTLEQL